jgi:hypothetical protein
VLRLFSRHCAGIPAEDCSADIGLKQRKRYSGLLGSTA